MSKTTGILFALIAGLLLGIASAAIGGGWVDGSGAVVEPNGALWLNALRMTIIPLVVSLVITGIAASAEAARASRLAGRALVFFIALLWISAALGAALTPRLLQLWPMATGSADALKSALTTTAPAAAVPGFADFIRSIVPTNPVAAAANDAILPLIVFTTLFAFALTRVPTEPRERLSAFFRAVSDVMLVIIGWLLRLAPVGVLALAYVLGARAGASAFGALVHYVVIVSAVGLVIGALAYAVAVFGGGLRIGPFARAIIPAQAVAISTQSSLASLPAMLRNAETLRVPVEASGVVLPLAVAIFRVTSPAMNIAVVLYVAHLLGIALGPTQIAAAVAVAAITTLSSVSLPGQITFVANTAPIALAVGVPVEPLMLLLAVENLPDIVRTVGNVTMDVAATATIARRSGYPPDQPAGEQDRLLRTAV